MMMDEQAGFERVWKSLDKGNTPPVASLNIRQTLNLILGAVCEPPVDVVVNPDGQVVVNPEGLVSMTGQTYVLRFLKPSVFFEAPSSLQV